MTNIRLDPQLTAVIDTMGSTPYVDLNAMSHEEAMRIARPALPLAPPPSCSEDRTIEGPDAADLRLRLYYPDARPEPLPVVLYLHGGGFVGGSVEMDDTRCSRLAVLTPCIVASLDYRLAPENPFPDAIEDAYTAWNWIVSNASQIGGDANRSAIYGSSAGGHLAVCAMLLALKRGSRLPGFQLLANPALDPVMASRSFRDFEHGPFMTKARMSWYWQQYHRGGKGDHQWLWAPLQSNLNGLPPAHVITAEYDVLRDEAENYAKLLRNSGIQSSVKRYSGMIHGFITVLPDHPTSVAAMKESAEILHDALR